MQSRRYYLLLHPSFISCILLLLLNDLYLKYNLHNWFTGKLSDFTGLYAFAFFLLAFFYPYRKTAIIFCCLFFTWWKSPLSSPFIAFINSILSVELARTVDLTDLIALCVLPVAWLISRRYNPPVIRDRFVYLNVSCVVSLFAFCNTSEIRRMAYRYPEETIFFSHEFATGKSEDEIVKLLSGNGNNYKKDSVHFYPAEKDSLYYRIQPTGGDIHFTPVTNNADSALFIKVKEYVPYYSVRSFNLQGDELANLEFRFSRGRKKNVVFIMSFQTRTLTPAEYYSGKLNRKYIRYFKELFR